MDRSHGSATRENFVSATSFAKGAPKEVALSPALVLYFALGARVRKPWEVFAAREETRQVLRPYRGIYLPKFRVWRFRR